MMQLTAFKNACQNDSIYVYEWQLEVKTSILTDIAEM